MGKLREFVSPQAALPSERAPPPFSPFPPPSHPSPPRQSNVVPPGPQPGAVSPISHQAWPGTQACLGHTALHSQSFSFSSSSNAFIPASSNKLSLGANRLQIVLPHPCHRPVSPNTTHPCPHPDRPILHQRNPPASVPSTTNELEARGPPFLLASRSIADPALSLPARRRQASSHRYRRPV